MNTNQKIIAAIVLPIALSLLSGCGSGAGRSLFTDEFDTVALNSPRGADADKDAGEYAPAPSHRPEAPAAGTPDADQVDTAGGGNADGTTGTDAAPADVATGDPADDDAGGAQSGDASNDSSGAVATGENEDASNEPTKNDFGHSHPNAGAGNGSEPDADGIDLDPGKSGSSKGASASND